MKLRAFCLGLAALVSLTSGCLPYRQHPCWGFRLHPCSTGGQCAPVCSSPIRSLGISHHRSPKIVSDCATCIGDGMVPHHAGAFPVSGYPVNGGAPVGGYPPVIGTPIPLTGGATVIPSHQLPNPMPVKPNGN